VLGLAMSFASPEMVSELLAQGASPLVTNIHGQDALMCACEFGRYVDSDVGVFVDVLSLFLSLSLFLFAHIHIHTHTHIITDSTTSYNGSNDFRVGM